MSSMAEDICELLDCYSGRDKVIRLACYAFKLYGCLKENKGWQTAGSRLSNARMMLRLFDDLPQMRYTLSYGLGRHEPTLTDSLLGVCGNLVDQVFLPVEKILWLHEVGVLKLSSTRADALDNVSTTLWAAGLCIALMQTLQSIQRLVWSRQCLQQSAQARSEAGRHLDVRLALAAVSAGKLCLDVTHAVSCLPRGCLWGATIGPTKVATLATTSSLIGLALYFAKKRFLK